MCRFARVHGNNPQVHCSIGVAYNTRMDAAADLGDESFKDLARSVSELPSDYKPSKSSSVRV